MSNLLLIVILLFTTTPAHPQRCGDSLLLFLRDTDGRVLAPSQFESATVSATYTIDNVTNLVDAQPSVRALPPNVESFSVRAECGMKEARFRLRIKKEEMILRVLNVPGDAGHILLEGITFRKGVYQVDLGGRPLRHVERYEGEASRAADPANEIRWVIGDKSLSRVP
jgi:hypothetical protein